MTEIPHPERAQPAGPGHRTGMICFHLIGAAVVTLVADRLLWQGVPGLSWTLTFIVMAAAAPLANPSIDRDGRAVAAA
ncbi:MAG TPA: hypothetical protein VKN63_11805, partial [Afifellaceae bacterium]|nr:hypothetical protein [Afifellaceae bacterium]